MNKRQAKKQLKKLDMWVGLDSTPNRCLYCAFYEPEDRSVGLWEGCEADYLYDKNGDFREELNDRAIAYMGRKGWNCPHFRFCSSFKKRQLKKIPKSYKEIKAAVKREERLYGFLNN